MTAVGTKQRIATWLRKFPHKFEVENKAIDLRAMVKNYPDGYIPLTDIAEGVNAVLGPPPVLPSSVDPRTQKKVPKFQWIKNEDAGINPIFQRDIAPNHTGKIEAHCDTRMILVPCAVKMEMGGKMVYLIWDGGHTAQLLIRQGWSHIPVWYTDVDSLDEAEMADARESMIGLAGRSMISINKKLKRMLQGYDEFMILYETKDADAMSIMNILRSNGCQPYRYKRQSGDVTHFEALWEVYELTNRVGLKGTYLDRALAFHRRHWPKPGIEAEIMRPMAMLYQLCDTQLGRQPSANFDADLGQLLASRFGSAEATQEGIKHSYAAAFPNGRDSNPTIVLSGLLNLYTRHVNKETVAVPPVRWDV
jgi:hypothetical protein